MISTTICGHDPESVRLKAQLNEEFQKTPRKNVFGIVWFHNENFSFHTAMSIGGELFSFFYGERCKETTNFQFIKGKVIEGQHPRVKRLFIQEISITPEQQRIVEEISAMKSLPCTTCMEAASIVLHDITGIKIPFPISVFPDLARRYLVKHQHQSGTPSQQIKEYGQPVNERIGIIANIALGSCYVTSLYGLPLVWLLSPLGFCYFDIETTIKIGLCALAAMGAFVTGYICYNI
jgi:hypothetical protein